MKPKLRVVGSNPEEDAWDVERQRYAELERKQQNLFWIFSSFVFVMGIAIAAVVVVVF